MENVEWVDFVTFDPRIIERPMFTIRVTREEWKPLIEEYIKLYAGFSIKMEESIDDITF